jgi:hypothetical protein
MLPNGKLAVWTNSGNSPLERGSNSYGWPQHHRRRPRRRDGHTHQHAVETRSRSARPGDRRIALVEQGGVHREDRCRLMASSSPPIPRPGELKDVRNFAGGDELVEPALVEGTLVNGFDVLDTLRSPLGRTGVPFERRAGTSRPEEPLRGLAVQRSIICCIGGL